MTLTAGVASKALAERLDAELTKMAIAQFESDEFRLVFETPLTIERARFVTLQMTFYNVNRRDCWAYAQAKAPWDVKRAIWEHEKDELYFDERGGGDHRALMSKQALALGVTQEQLEAARPTALVEGSLMGFCHAAATLPWLGSITVSHFLERRNNSDLIPGGGFSKRFRDKVIQDCGIPSERLISSNVHVAADVDHSDSIWSAIASYIADQSDYDLALEGARISAVLDRAFRASLAHGMRAI
jgi:hypothetical protein